MILFKIDVNFQGILLNFGELFQVEVECVAKNKVDGEEGREQIPKEGHYQSQETKRRITCS